MTEPMRLYQAPSTELRGRPRPLSAAGVFGGVTAPAPARTTSTARTDAKQPLTAIRPSSTPTWSQIESAPKYQALDAAGKESVRLSFWRDVVSPLVPTDQLEEALGHFERRTGGPLKAVRAGPPPTDAELERASKPARMVVTKQGQAMFGRQAEGTIGVVRDLQRRSPVLKRYTDPETAVIVGAGLNAQRSDQAGGRLHPDDEEPASMP